MPPRAISQHVIEQTGRNGGEVIMPGSAMSLINEVVTAMRQ
jgi:hypothetical protein